METYVVVFIRSAFLISTHCIWFHEEIRKLWYFLVEKVPYMELCKHLPVKFILNPGLDIAWLEKFWWSKKDLNPLYAAKKSRALTTRHPVHCTGRAIAVIQGPVVQSVVSLTSSLRVISLTVLADSIYNILIFFAEKMWVAFALRKLLTFFQQKISEYLCITRCKF